MAKGQKRSNREAKKPKKAVAEKLKAGMAAVFRQAPVGAGKDPAKKT